MDYERIEKPQGSGLSPSKLRSMLLKVDRRSKEWDEGESVYSLRSEAAEVEDSGGNMLESYKDVTECSTSGATETVACGSRSDGCAEFTASNFRIRCYEDSSATYSDSTHNNSNVCSGFEFQKADRVLQRVPFVPFSKPAPSKWDDAQKWIASPTSSIPKTGHLQTGHFVGSRRTAHPGYCNRLPASLKVVTEVPELNSEEADTKRIDSSHVKNEIGQKCVNWVPDVYTTADSFTLPDLPANPSPNESSISCDTAGNFIPSTTPRPVAMRDMGTEMTPIASQDPSRNGTPVRATTPTRSPRSSIPLTPGVAAPSASPTEVVDPIFDPNLNRLSDKELQMKTRQEIIALGTQLGKMNIAAWASMEEEKDTSTSLKTVVVGQSQSVMCAIDARAAAWEEAEKAKYMARYKREEIKIQAWESHQKAKSEAELRRLEVIAHHLLQNQTNLQSPDAFNISLCTTLAYRDFQVARKQPFLVFFKSSITRPKSF